MATDVTTTTDVTTAPAGAVASGVLRGQRRTLVLWAVAIAAVSAMYLSFYPAIGDDGMTEMVEMLPEDLATALGYDQLGDAAGYLTSTVYALLGAALLLVFGIGTGARLVAGEEEDGTLELELSHPVGRRAMYVERLAALWGGVALLTLAVGIVSWLCIVAFGLDVGGGALVAGTVGLALFAGFHATLAFAIGAATGRRAVALAIAAGLAVAGYIANAVGPLIDVAWLATISPWDWYLGNDPLREGFDVAGYGLLAILAVVIAAAGAVRYERRDLGV